MDYTYQKLLQQHQQEIIDDLEPIHILDELFSKKVITDEDYDDIRKFDRREQARYLIDTLLRHGDNQSFRVFVNTLAKDYSWLYNKLIVENNEQMLNESFEDSLSKGDVPRLPEHHVRRVALEQDIANELKQLSRHKILVLRGMSGCGKTCAAISVLRNNAEIVTNFGGVVLWLNFGTCKTEDDIIAQQNKLLRKATSMYVVHSSIMTNSISVSSISSNLDNMSLSTYNWTWEELRDKLKNCFLESTLKESLLVLDEVNERKIVEAFDIGCKIMITTRDVDVVAKFNAQIVKVQNSFEEKEALELFASCLDEEVAKLPPQAKKLNEICKGTPFNIALIGAQLAENKERLKDDPGYWKNYLNKLEKKGSFFSFKSNDKPMKTIEMCINSLDSYVLPLYKRLAVLPDNVKVFPKVLSTIWNVDVADAESILKSLTRKSLIIESYDRDHINYAYEVHDLIMNYLRANTKADEMKKLHNDLLNSYNYDDVDNVSFDIPDDGYIAFKIGHHILKTDNYNQKWNLFNKLFLALKFLGNKVRLTGVDDVNMDLQNYEFYIVKDELDRQLVQSVRTFLSKHGTDLHHYPRTDMLQSVLQHEAAGILHHRAAAAAMDCCRENELYFEFLHEQDVDEVKHSTIDVRESITAVCFLGNYVLVGTNNGTIKFFHSTTHKLEKELKGMVAPVIWVGVSCVKQPPVVAALSLDGAVKLWYVHDFDDEAEVEVIEEEPEESYNNIHPDHITLKQDFGPYKCCRWSANEDFLVAHTAKMIFLFGRNGVPIHTINPVERDRDIVCCVPCNNDRYVAIATNSTNRNIEVIDLETKDRVISFTETEHVLDMVMVPGTNRIIALKRNEVVEHEFKLNSVSSNKCSMCHCKSVIKSDSVKDNLSFKAIAVNKTGTLLFVSTDDSRVICINLKTYTAEFDLENRRGNVIAMAVSEVLMWDEFEPGSDVLLTGTDITENSVKVWYLDPSFVSQSAKRKGKVRLTSKFAVSFVSASSPLTPVQRAAPPPAGPAPARRHASFHAARPPARPSVKNSLSLDRHALKPLSLKGICNNNDAVVQPLLAVVDDKNNIQVMRGRKLLTEILEKSDDRITCLTISPCNHYVIYGLQSGSVKKYTLKTKEMVTIMDVYSPVAYLNYVSPNLLMVAGKNRSLMAYRFTEIDWTVEMLQRGNTHLGSQELLNELQGVKMKNGQADCMSTASGDSGSSDSRVFNSEARGESRGEGRGDIRGLCGASGVLQCFWVHAGLVTVEHNAATKLWTHDMQVAAILHARQPDVHITCTAMKNNVLVLCDSDNKRFQTFELINGELKSIQDYTLNTAITSCDITADGNILALGLESGNVMVWNVRGKRLIATLKHHKSRVQCCRFSPVPERLYRSPSMYAASPPHSAHALPPATSPPTTLPAAPLPSDADDDQPPLVLVTVAAEIVWWNITHSVRARANQRFGWRKGVNAMTPAGTPLENRTDVQSSAHNSNTSQPNFFFGDGLLNQHCWREVWKGKTCKKGSKRKEILSCIKLTGVYAKKLYHDDGFTCFVTVDNAGHIHIMNVMRPACS